MALVLSSYTQNVPKAPAEDEIKTAEIATQSRHKHLNQHQPALLSVVSPSPQGK